MDGRKKPEISGPDNTASFAYASVGNKSFPRYERGDPACRGRGGALQASGAGCDAGRDLPLLRRARAQAARHRPPATTSPASGCSFSMPVPRPGDSVPSPTAPVSHTDQPAACRQADGCGRDLQRYLRIARQRPARAGLSERYVPCACGGRESDARDLRAQVMNCGNRDLRRAGAQDGRRGRCPDGPRSASSG